MTISAAVWIVTIRSLEHLWTPEQLVAVATSHPLNFAPGAKWRYSNTGYIVLGLIAEKSTGDTIAHQIEQRIVAPLGLANTTFETEAQLGGRQRGRIRPRRVDARGRDATRPDDRVERRGGSRRRSTTRRGSSRRCSGGGCSPSLSSPR